MKRTLLLSLGVLVFASMQAFSQIAFVQAKGASANFSSTIPVSIAAAAGNTAVVAVSYTTSGSGKVVKVEDDAGSVYSFRAKQAWNIGGNAVELWSTEAGSLLSGVSQVTVTLSLPLKAAASVGEYGGVVRLGNVSIGNATSTTEKSAFPVDSLATQDTNNFVVTVMGGLQTDVRQPTITALTGNLRDIQINAGRKGGTREALFDNTAATASIVANAGQYSVKTFWETVSLELRSQ